MTTTEMDESKQFTINELFDNPDLINQADNNLECKVDMNLGSMVITDTDTENETYLNIYDNGVLYRDNYSNIIHIYQMDTPVELDNELDCVYFD